MQISGYQIREAIKRWELRRSTSDSQWQDSFFKFKDENKIHPEELMQVYLKADESVAKLPVLPITL